MISYLIASAKPLQTWTMEYFSAGKHSLNHYSQLSTAKFYTRLESSLHSNFGNRDHIINA